MTAGSHLRSGFDPGPARRRGRRRGDGGASALGLAVVLALALVAAGCADDGVAATLPELDPSDAVGAAGGPDGDGSGSATDEPERVTVEIPVDWESEIEEVYGRYWLYWDAFAAAHGPPFADPDYEPLRLLSSPDNWASLQSQLRGFQDDGLVLVLPENSRSDHLLRLPETVAFDKREGDELVLQDCWIDDFVQQTTDGLVVLAAAEAKLMNVTMKVVDGEWTVHGVTRSTADSDWFEECDALQPTP